MYTVVEVKVKAECPEKNILLANILRRIGGPFILSTGEDAIKVPCRYIREDIGGILVSLYLYSRIAGSREIVFGVDPGSSFTGVVVILGDHIVFKGVVRRQESVVEAIRVTTHELGRAIVFIGDTPLARRIVEKLGSNVEYMFVPENVHGGSLEYTGLSYSDRHVRDALKIALKGLYLRISKSSRPYTSSRGQRRASK